MTEFIIAGVVLFVLLWVVGGAILMSGRASRAEEERDDKYNG